MIDIQDAVRDPLLLSPVFLLPLTIVIIIIITTLLMLQLERVVHCAFGGSSSALRRPIFALYLLFLALQTRRQMLTTPLMILCVYVYDTKRVVISCIAHLYKWRWKTNGIPFYKLCNYCWKTCLVQWWWWWWWCDDACVVAIS